MNSKHRWDIAHKGHCKWFYPNHDEQIIEIFFDIESPYNIEHADTYVLDYDKKWYNKFNELVDKNNYKLRIWKKAEQRGYWYVEYIVGNHLIDISEKHIIVYKEICDSNK